MTTPLTFGVSLLVAAALAFGAGSVALGGSLLAASALLAASMPRPRARPVRVRATQRR